MKYLVLTLVLCAAPVFSTSGRAQSQKKALDIPNAVLPKVGTRIVNTYFVTDSLGNTVDPKVANPEMGDDTQFVVRSGVRAHGRANCILMTGPAHQDTNVMSFAKNGDVYMLNTNHGEKWEKLPFSLKPGKVEKTEPYSDTGTSVFGHYDMMDHREYYVAGYDTSSIAGKVVNCVILRLVEVKVFEGTVYKNAATYWFSPEAGYIARQNFGWGGSYFLNQQVASYDPPEK